MEMDLPDVPRQQPGELLKLGLSHVHKAFADYMLMNPGCKLREMAAHFGYTVPWLSTVIRSDMFQAYLNTRREGIDVEIAQDLPSRLMAAGHLATERLIEVLEKTGDSDTIVDSFDKIMHRLGYGPKTQAGVAGTVNNTQNVFLVSKEDLAQARGSLVQQHEKVVDGTVVNVIPATST